MLKIDEKTVVPIRWVLGGIGAIVSITTLGVFWISSVNFRLSRIEEKLGIPKLAQTAATIPSAEGAEK